MPTLREHQSKKIMRLLGIGDPSTGKTGSLVALINALPRFGIERVIIQDWDDGLDILSAHVEPEKMDLVHFETLRDDMRATQVGVQVMESTAFPRGMALLNNWKTKTEELGRAIEWGPETLLVEDTITGLGDACMNFATDKLKIDDNWRAVGAAMQLQGKLIQMLVALNCHVILFSHIRFMGGGGKIEVISKDQTLKSTKEVDSNVDGQAYPSALGRILPPTVGRHFNTQLEWELQGKYRKIRTVPKDRMALKVPFKLRDELPQETGLVDVFKAYLER